jgi:hypothetical protein
LAERKRGSGYDFLAVDSQGTIIKPASIFWRKWQEVRSSIHIHIYGVLWEESPMRRVGTLGFLAAVACLPLFAAAPPSCEQESDEARQQVLRLQDDSFSVREEATQNLQRMGRSALPSLQWGLANLNEEAVRRCRLLLAELSLLPKDPRLADFLRGKPIALPGWTTFQAIFGDDMSARQLYLELYRSDRPLLKLLEHDPCQVGLQYQRLAKPFRLKDPRVDDSVYMPLPAEYAAFLLSFYCGGTHGLEETSQFLDSFEHTAVVDLLGSAAILRAVEKLMPTDLGGYLEEFEIWGHHARTMSLKDYADREIGPLIRRNIRKALREPVDWTALRRNVQIARELDLRDHYNSFAPYIRRLIERAAPRFREPKQVDHASHLIFYLDLPQVAGKTLRNVVHRAVNAAVADPRNKVKMMRAARMMMAVDNEIRMGEDHDRLIGAVAPLILEASESLADWDKLVFLANLCACLGIQDQIDTGIAPAVEKRVLALLEREELPKVVEAAELMDLCKGHRQQGRLQATIEETTRRWIAKSVRPKATLTELAQLQRLVAAMGPLDPIEDDHPFTKCRPHAMRLIQTALRKPASAYDRERAVAWASLLRITEAFPLALKQALDPRAAPASRVNAINYMRIVWPLNPRIIPQMKPLLSDKTVLKRKKVEGKIVEMQVRDAALAVIAFSLMLHLEEFGYEGLEAIPKELLGPISGLESGVDVSRDMYGFSSPIRREEAHRKGTVLLARIELPEFIIPFDR